jgi:hypothetical protein
MFQENKSLHQDSYDEFSLSPPIPSPHPIFREIPELPRASDFVSSSLSGISSSDVFRSLETPSGVASFSPDAPWGGLGPGPRGFVEPPKTLDDVSTHYRADDWSESFSSVQQFDKAKSIEDLQSPWIESFPATSGGQPSPPAVPDYVDPCYHFSSQMQPNGLFQKILAILKVNSVDVQPKPEKFRMKCSQYSSGSELLFVIRIYTGVKDYVVECQRRRVHRLGVTLSG